MKQFFCQSDLWPPSSRLQKNSELGRFISFIPFLIFLGFSSSLFSSLLLWYKQELCALPSNFEGWLQNFLCLCFPFRLLAHPHSMHRIFATTFAIQLYSRHQHCRTRLFLFGVWDCRKLGSIPNVYEHPKNIPKSKWWGGIVQFCTKLPTFSPLLPETCQLYSSRHQHPAMDENGSPKV